LNEQSTVYWPPALLRPRNLGQTADDVEPGLALGQVCTRLKIAGQWYFHEWVAGHDEPGRGATDLRAGVQAYLDDSYALRVLADAMRQAGATAWSFYYVPPSNFGAENARWLRSWRAQLDHPEP